MSLMELQSCLARLYTSEVFRMLYLREPDEALDGYDLSPHEAESLRSLDPKMINVFAATLVAKRARRAHRAYGSSYAWHGPALDRLFHRFLELQGSRPQPTVHHETVAFGHFAEQALSDLERFPDAAAELVRFERSSYEAMFTREPPVQRPGPLGRPLEDDDVVAVAPGVVVEKFRHDVIALDEALRSDGATQDVAALTSWIAFRPGRDDGGQRLLRLNGPTATIVRSCQPACSAGDVVRQVAQELGAEDLRDAVLAGVAQLAELGILRINLPTRTETPR
ncbi:hypothetical protein [Nocardioides aequoreus]|uniref:hypothetical protein n=1 Tax=Nocardioides aequoreus TaxID=397278 RepID=UPI0004C38CB7|nr:hypothetical protein [Nocardioides aequoreus]